MEKNMYPQVPTMPGATDAPPSYNQTYQPNPSAPVAVPLGMALQSSIAHPEAVIVHTPIPPLGPRPCLVICPSCHQQLISKVRHETSTNTHLIAALICAIGLVCCACVPYCMNTCKNANHYCSNCDAYLGMYTNK